jgi:hypothetical protein
MADQQVHKPGGHYSGANPVPTISKFIESLDRDKKNRDAQIDSQGAPTNETGGDAVPHTASPKPKSSTQKTVTDPVTGNNVVIEDASKDMFKHVNNPMVFIRQCRPYLLTRLTQAALRSERESR